MYVMSKTLRWVGMTLQTKLGRWVGMTCPYKDTKKIIEHYPEAWKVIGLYGNQSRSIEFLRKA